MKTVSFVIALLVLPVTVFAEAIAVETSSTDNQKNSADVLMFSIETDEQTASDSLNRVAGDIDLGFSAPSQSYKSGNQKNVLIDKDKHSNPVE